MTNEQTHEKIKEVADSIGKKFQSEKIILFGSHAWGQPGSDSDVDLLRAHAKTRMLPLTKGE